jgi:predicted nucleic acid-binding Zn ribbon protein
MIEQHKHCPVCGAPMPLNEKYCSPNCEQLAIANQKKVQKTRKMLYVLFAVFILVWLFFMFRGQLGF